MFTVCERKLIAKVSVTNDLRQNQTFPWKLGLNNSHSCFIEREHYENTPMQYIANKILKMKIFTGKKFDIFLIFAQNIDCGYTLEPPRRGGSNEYPQYMFWSKNKKNRYTPAYPSFTI